MTAVYMHYSTKGFLTAFFACSAVLFFLGAFLSSVVVAAAFTCNIYGSKQQKPQTRTITSLRVHYFHAVHVQSQSETTPL